MSVDADMAAIKTLTEQLCARIHEHTFAHYQVRSIEHEAANAAHYPYQPFRPHP